MIVNGHWPVDCGLLSVVSDSVEAAPALCGGDGEARGAWRGRGRGGRGRENAAATACNKFAGSGESNDRVWGSLARTWERIFRTLPVLFLLCLTPDLSRIINELEPIFLI